MAQYTAVSLSHAKPGGSTRDAAPLLPTTLVLSNQIFLCLAHHAHRVAMIFAPFCVSSASLSQSLFDRSVTNLRVAIAQGQALSREGTPHSPR